MKLLLPAYHTAYDKLHVSAVKQAIHHYDHLYYAPPTRKIKYLQWKVLCRIEKPNLFQYFPQCNVDQNINEKWNVTLNVIAIITIIIIVLFFKLKLWPRIKQIFNTNSCNQLIGLVVLNIWKEPLCFLEQIVSVVVPNKQQAINIY